MFANQRRGTAGLGSLTGVALVLVAWLISTGVMIKVYQEGGTSTGWLAPDSNCELVCQVPAVKLKKT